MKMFILSFNIIFSVIALLSVAAKGDLSYILLVMGVPVYFITFLLHLIWGITDAVETKKFSILISFIIVIIFYALAMTLLPSGFGRQ